MYDEIEKLRKRQNKLTTNPDALERAIQSERELIDGRIDVVMFKVENLSSLAQKLNAYLSEMVFQK